MHIGPESDGEEFRIVTNLNEPRLGQAFGVRSGEATGRVRACLRAVGELRRGEPVTLLSGGDAKLVMIAGECVDDGNLAVLHALGGAVDVITTYSRAVALGLPVDADDGASAEDDREGRPARLRASRGPATAAWIRSVTDPLVLGDGADPDIAAVRPLAVLETDRRSDESHSAAIGLLKLARLLPTAAVVEMPASVPPGVLSVECADIAFALRDGVRTLTLVSRARVPLADAETAEMVTFRPADGGKDHVAILIGDPDPSSPILARLHSECFTGDLLASLRCDCGDQLRGAVRQIVAEGSGVILYMAQEGRGIGLSNKLKAYALQDLGADTLDANLRLGYEADERVFGPAASILLHLGFRHVRLMTNNPRKVEAFQRSGIEVVQRVPLTFAANGHNDGYLRTKASRFGHDL